jgi:hypothetical protein
MNASRPKAYTIPGVDAMPSAMATPLQRASVGTKAVDLDFDGGRLSSDAGLVLLHDPDEHLGLPRDLAAVLSDPRDARRVHFPQHDLLKPRVWHMAAGDADANDSNPRRHDPMCKLRLERLPDTGAPWASPPTISRFENRISRPELSRMALVCLEPLIASYDRPPKVIVLAFDDPAAPVHGGQEQARYDGADGGDCCRPLHLEEGLAGRWITPIFKAKRFTGVQMLAGLKRLVKRLRHAWPHPLMIVRGDRHCASPEVRQGVDEQAALSDVHGLTSNAVLKT